MAVVVLAAILLALLGAAYCWRKAAFLARYASAFFAPKHRKLMERWQYLGYRAIAVLLVALAVATVVVTALR